jgi:hypothetical protein
MSKIQWQWQWLVANKRNEKMKVINNGIAETGYSANINDRK